MTEHSLTWVEINKQAILQNLALFKKVIGPKTKLMAVVKSNAYGHGIIGIAELIKDQVDYFGVVNLEEALNLRKNLILTTPILVLSYYDSEQVEEALKNDIELTIYDSKIVQTIAQTAQKLKKRAYVHLKVDTGTSRLGILPKDVETYAQTIIKLKGIELKGIFTHFADSENDDWTFTDKQILTFKNILFNLQKLNIRIPLAHASCSAATLSSRETHFDLVRIGIALYGLWPSEKNKRMVKKRDLELELEPALTWKTKIIQIKELEKGANVGYGCAYKTRRKVILAVLPVGYNEGYDRLLSNKGEVLIKGKKCPILGRVCMNLTMVDVTKVPETKVGEEVVLIGKQGEEEITAEEIAEKINTINYEVITRINPLIPRIYC